MTENTMMQEHAKQPLQVELAKPEDAAEAFDVQRLTSVKGQAFLALLTPRAYTW